VGTTDVEQAIVDRLTEVVRQRLDRLPADQLADTDPATVADAMLDAMPTEHPFTRLGPFYTTTRMVRWRNITRQALHQKVKARQVLASETVDGLRVYPAWQFMSDGRSVPGLTAVLPVLLAATDPWTAAIWLTTPSERLDGRSAIDTLRSGLMAWADLGAERLARDQHPLRATQRVLAVVREDAARWAE